MTPDQWRMAHELEKFEGGCAIPAHMDVFVLDTARGEFAQQIVEEVLRSWPVISNGTYASIRVQNPHELN